MEQFYRSEAPSVRPLGVNSHQAFESPFYPLQAAQFIARPVNACRPVCGRFDDGLTPTGEHDPLDGHLCGKVLVFRGQILLDDREGFNDGLKAVVAAEGQEGG